MSQSTPADLAIAFRSLPRRLREASALDVAPEAVASANSAVDDAVATCARLMGCEETLESIAVCIEQRHLTEWSAGDLDVLAAQARHAGTAIRVVHDLADSNR